MEAITRMPLKLFQVFQSVNVFLDHVHIVYNKEGITFEGMDQSHVCLIKASVKAEEWETYRLLYGVPGSFGISLKHLTRVLKHATGEDRLTMRQDPNEKKAVFHIELTGPDRSVAIPIPLIDIEEDSLDIPDVDYGFTMSLFPKVWHSYISTFDVIEPHTISLFPTNKTTDYIVLKGEGEMSDMSMTIRADRPITGDDPVSARKDLTRYTKITKADGPSFEVPLSASMMKQMGGFSKSMTKIEVCLQEGMPALFRYVNGDTVKVDIYLAPKLMGDDDFE